MERSYDSLKAFLEKDPRYDHVSREVQLFAVEEEESEFLSKEIKKNFGPPPYEFLTQEEASDLGIPEKRTQRGSRKRGTTYLNDRTRPSVPNQNAFGAPQFIGDNGLQYKLAYGDFMKSIMDTDKDINEYKWDDFSTESSTSMKNYGTVVMFVKIPRNSSKNASLRMLTEGQELNMHAALRSVGFSGRVSELIHPNSKRKTAAVIIKDFTITGPNFDRKIDTAQLDESKYFASI